MDEQEHEECVKTPHRQIHIVNQMNAREASDLCAGQELKEVP